MGNQFKFEKSFYDWIIENSRQDILDRWDWELNKTHPRDISSTTKIKYAFKCDKNKSHHSEFISIQKITLRNHSISCKQCNSFAQYLLDEYGDNGIDIYWSKENIVSPWDLAAKSEQKVLINCIENKKHKAYPIGCDKFVRGQRCQICLSERKCSVLQMKIRNYILEKYPNYNLTHEFNCSIVPSDLNNTKTKYPFDNIIEDFKIIIETMGIQHDQLTGYHKLSAKRNNTTPEYELQQQKLRDLQKKLCAYRNGYFYVAVPYSSENDESYKTIIDKAISYAKNSVNNYRNNKGYLYNNLKYPIL